MGCAFDSPPEPRRPRRVLVLYDRETETTMRYDPDPKLQFWKRGDNIPGTYGPVVEEPSRRRWLTLGLCALGVLVVAVPWWLGVLYLLRIL